MADVTIPGLTTQLTSVDRAADLLEVSDTSDSGNSKKSSVNNLLDLTSHPVGINDVQTLTNKTVTAPTISSPVLSGSVTGTYTLAGTPTFPSVVVTLTGSQTLTNKVLTSPTVNAPTITNPTITTDAVSEFTSANGVTIDGLNIKDSALVTANSVPNNTLSNTGAFGSAWGWADWTPAWTNFTVGNGVLNYANFQQVGKTTLFKVKFTLGTTSAVTGLITFSSPVTLNGDYTTVNDGIDGLVHLVDTGTNLFYGSLAWASSTTIAVYSQNAASTSLLRASTSSTVPMTWASTDVIQISGFIEA